MIASLKTKLSLGHIGTKGLDFQFLHGTSKLGQDISKACIGVINPEVAMFIGVQPCRATTGSQKLLQQTALAKITLLQHLDSPAILG